MVAEVDGTWDALDWSADDKEILAHSSSPDPPRHASGVSTSSPDGARSSRRRAGHAGARGPRRHFSADGRAVFALSDRESEVTRVWSGDLATGKWTPLTAEGVAIEGFLRRARRHPARRRRRSRRDERAAVRRRADAASIARCRRSRRASSGSVAGIGSGDAARHRVRWRAHVPRRLRGRRQERQARALDHERDGRSEAGCAARRRDRPVEELRRPHDSRHPLSSREALHRAAARHDQRPRRTGNARAAAGTRAEQLLPQRARHGDHLPEHPRLDRLRQDLRAPRRWAESRGCGQGHRRAARLDRGAVQSSTRTA